MNLGFGVFHWMALVTLLVTARKSNSLKCYFTYNCRSYEQDGSSKRCIEGGKLEIYRKNFILKNDTHANTCIIILFLVACTRLYNPLCRSVGPSVRRSVGPSVRRSVRPSVRHTLLFYNITSTLKSF